ncbi:putative alpha beta hydrolase family protein [Rosellinia necatrix]|uniref:Putative alpha beta hydrolase family protein n=1 Tax=Rosellinia necatrix TaxID=77044 RepID=A0A1W2TTR8_ROSNE|nr:putative alpha beta hydrolase family protein [Rosellinia necatrix]
MPGLSLRIIPAASALPPFYDAVVGGVSRHGYDIRALHIPSVGPAAGEDVPPGAPPTMYDDAAFVAAHVAGLADAGRDVVLVTHSYGGTPATEAVRGLAKSARLAQGKAGGIVGLAYMNSLVPEVGHPASTVVGTAPPGQQPLMLVGDDGWFYYPNLTYTAEIVFSDLPRPEGEAWARRLVKHSAASFAGNLTYGGYRDVPVAYLVAEDDRSLQPATQRAQIDMIERVSGREVDVTSIRSGHAVPVSHPQDVIDWILGVARKFS